MLIAENITKRFAGVTALDNVCLAFEGGAVTAILGENGAGKSTLMKILSGVYADYEGQILFRGKPVRFSSVREAQQCGIAIIHQELALIPYLSITENIFLGRELTTRWGMLDRKGMRLKTSQLLTDLRLSVDPDTLVGDLKVGQQQVVEIAKALLVESEVIIMDEPTSAISDSEVEVLFGIIADLRKKGKAVVYISHKLNELVAIADRYIVLRDGKTIESGTMHGANTDSLIRAMVGRNMTVAHRKTGELPSKSVLEVNQLCLSAPGRAGKNQSDDNLLKNISFNVGGGEVVGLFGLMGAGRTELLETLFGLHPARMTGTITVEKQLLTIKTPADAIKAGIALVPEDRKRDGLVLGMDVQTNISLTTLETVEQNGLLNKTKESTLAKKYIAELGIKTPSEKQTAQFLSGGNQQKIVLSKWLATNPKLLLLDEPTRGIDVKAKNEIYKLIGQLANAGMGILVVSSELPEILALSDRILVMCEGALTAELAANEATEDAILKAAIPG